MKTETLAHLWNGGCHLCAPFSSHGPADEWTLPEKVKQGLDYIPTAILSAIVFPLFFFDSASDSFMIQPQILLSAIPVFVFSWRVRSVWGAVLLGMGVYWGLGFIF